MQRFIFVCCVLKTSPLLSQVVDTQAVILINITPTLSPLSQLVDTQAVTLINITPTLSGCRHTDGHTNKHHPYSLRLSTHRRSH